jgi:hypothetical protein
MKHPILTFDGQIVNAAQVWVHLQPPKHSAFVPYSIEIPLATANEVFFSRKPDNTSWTDYIWDEIANLGTFVVEGYIKNILRLTQQQRGTFEWVIITVDDVLESDESIRLSGKAVRFLHHKLPPELKTLE